MELEHHFRVLAPDVQLCVVDNVVVALHPEPDGARCLLFDVDGPSADRSLSPVCEPAVLDGTRLCQVPRLRPLACLLSKAPAPLLTHLHDTQTLQLMHIWVST